MSRCMGDLCLLGLWLSIPTLTRLVPRFRRVSPTLFFIGQETARVA